MQQIPEKEKIKRFKEYATEEDFEELKKKIRENEIQLSVGRGKSRKLLKSVQRTYYYMYFLGSIALALLTIYLVYLQQALLAGCTFFITIFVFIGFWMTMTRRIFAWAMKEKRNFDYAYYTGVLTINTDKGEMHFPVHWRDALLVDEDVETDEESGEAKNEEEVKS